MECSKVNLKIDEGVGFITLNNPLERNVISEQMLSELEAALRHCNDEIVRVVVITGKGAHFCSGVDVDKLHHVLKDDGSHELSAYLFRLTNKIHKDVISKIRQLRKPVIASINGLVLGEGLGLALACDLRIAAKDARFLLGYTNIGTTATCGITYYLPRLIGSACASELFMLNQPISAGRALEVGLVNRVVPADDLNRHATELARRLATGPTLAYGRTKLLMDNSWSGDLISGLDQEARTIAEMALTGDVEEGINAFIEKRRPKFKDA